MVSTAFIACMGFAIALSPWFVLVLVLSVAWGVGDGVLLVAEQNIFQRRTPDAVRSRVLGASEGVFHGTLALSYIAAAFVLPVVGPRGMYALFGVATLLSVVVLLPLLRRGRATAEPAVGRADAS